VTLEGFDVSLAWVRAELSQYTDQVLNIWAGLSDVKDGAYALKVDYAVRALCVGRTIFWGCRRLRMRESSSDSKGGGLHSDMPNLARTLIIYTQHKPRNAPKASIMQR
jgi:hypothetical protein